MTDDAIEDKYSDALEIQLAMIETNIAWLKNDSTQDYVTQTFNNMTKWALSNASLWLGDNGVFGSNTSNMQLGVLEATRDQLKKEIEKSSSDTVKK